LKVCTMEVIRRQLLWEILSFLRKAVLNKIHPSDGPALAIYISLSMDNAIRTKLWPLPYNFVQYGKGAHWI